MDEPGGLLEVAPSTVQFGGWAELARDGGAKLERSLLITVPASLATGSDSVRVLVSAPCSARRFRSGRPISSLVHGCLGDGGLPGTSYGAWPQTFARAVC